MIRLKDKLSHLTYTQACKFLGPKGAKLIREGGKYDIDLSEQVTLTRHLFQLHVNGAVVTMQLDPMKNQLLRYKCSRCDGACTHLGAAFSLILEEKLALGLAAPPPERTPVEGLSDEELVKQAIEERAERAQTEKMRLKSFDTKRLWTDYVLTNRSSGKSYRVALRGWERGESFCTCPDFRKNTLGTCKHILHVTEKMKSRFNKSIRETRFKIEDVSVYIRYGEELELRLLIPEELDKKAMAILRPVKERAVKDVRDLLERIRAVERLGHEVTVYPDAEEYINMLLYRDRVAAKMGEIRRDPGNHPLRKTLLKTELLPYQMDGIAFAVGAGRAIIADDMGLGKTIQGIGVAELLAQDVDISKVLIICPASLKSQWRLEIKKFSDRSCQLVLGKAHERAEQYDGPAFFTICNYEQVLRDILSIERVRWDFIILDEGQRIKNWAAKTSRLVKGLRSTFALVLTGTPIENRLDELFGSITSLLTKRAD